MNNKNEYFIDETSSIGSDSKIYPGVVIEKGCKIGNNVVIQNGTLISGGVTIGNNCFIGPFTVIRDNSSISDNVLVGPHCEIARSEVHEGAKIAHRTYLGDTVIEKNVSIGCGTVVANTNFETRFKTVIGSDSLIGANVTLISPITIGSHCFVAAGTILAKNIPDDTFIRLDLNYHTKKN